MKDNKQIILVGIIFFCGYMLLQEWNAAHAPKHPVSANSEQAAETAQLAAQEKPTSFIKAPSTKPFIHVTTDVLTVAIDPQGGRIVKVDLPLYKQTVGKPNPVSLLTTNPNHFYGASFGFSGDESLVFSSQQSAYVLSDAKKTLSVVLTASDKLGRHIQKQYQFVQGSYVIHTKTTLSNPKQSAAWKGQFYAQMSGASITQHHAPQGIWQNIKEMWHRFWGGQDTPSAQTFVAGNPNESSSGIFGLKTYVGAAYHGDNKSYIKVPYSNMAKSDLEVTARGGWIAVQGHYFISAWVPQAQNKLIQIYSKWQDGFVDSERQKYDQSFAFGYKSTAQTVAPAEKRSNEQSLYVGPEIAKNLAGLGPSLDLTIDYGWLWFFSSALYWVLSQIHHYVPNWGIATIIVTILVKLVFYKLSASAYRSTARMRKLQPRVQSIQQRYADDPAQRNQAMMDLYRKEKVNPIGGCLPMLVQMPFILALYYVFLESIELRHAAFLWIPDLSTKDPYYILPLLMGISMWLQQQLNPTPPDPAQAKMMNVLPVVMTLMFSQFPAGLVLYWLTQNILSFAQQWVITKEFGIKHPLQHSKKT